jgi:hypothetical protein
MTSRMLVCLTGRQKASFIEMENILSFDHVLSVSPDFL